MTTTLYARPYDLDATGFHFESATDYEQKAESARNTYSQPVEEFEISFVDSDDHLAAELFKALKIDQTNLEPFFAAMEDWDNEQKLRVYLAVDQCSAAFDIDTDSPNDIDIDIYELDSMKALAEQFVDEGLYGEIPNALVNYIDYEAIARDLKYDYSEADVNGKHYIFRCD